MKKSNFIITAFLICFFQGQSAFAQITLNLRLFIEGYYTASNTGLMDNFGAGGCLFINGISNDAADVDTVDISAMDAVNYTVVETRKAILKTDGNVNVNFQTLNTGSSYYIRVKHRNTIQTWSAQPIIFNSITSYDFTTAQTQAYGNNMVQTFDALHWAFYSGDINQDQIVDSIDYALETYAVLHTLTGYILEDITGDAVAEGLDWSILENNSYFHIQSQFPLLIGVNEVLKNNSNSDISVFPNPNSGNFNLKLLSDKKDEKEIVILNINGQIVYRKIFCVDPGNNLLSIVFPPVEAGNYILEINSRNAQSKAIILNIK